ncbi:MAG: hypothetical protein KC420_00460 [Myxococcales bacterium]|nr:hypothetical protein [Myxococcales bacterium]MCB9568367.1 hypothetical protein [Myxococcales bacterium]
MDRLSPALAAALALVGGGCFVDPGVISTGGSQGSTSDASTTTGAATTSTSSTTGGESSSSGAASATTGGAIGDPVAFRIRTMVGVDPHYYGELMMGQCADLTDLFNLGIDGELSGGDVSYVMIFYPADPKAAETPLQLIRAQCNGALDTCSASPDDLGLMTVARNSQGALCSTVVVGTLNSAYSGDGAPNLPGAPCFISDEGDAAVPIADTLPAIALERLSLAATYVQQGEDVVGLVKGSLRGYLRESSAAAVDGEVAGVSFNLWGSIAGGGSCQLDPMSPIDDTDPNPDPRSDEAGVWVYFNFEADLVEWLE